MGGDVGPEVTVPAALAALAREPELDLILVGAEREIESRIVGHEHRDRIHVRNASQVVGMDESPASALRGKKDSSMRIAVNQVKEGHAQACVSAGNTGVLMATARFVLKTLPNIDRPAICGALPRAGGQVYILDLGANVDVPPNVLFQFGVMGSTLVSLIEGIPRPTVGLLNVGVEDIKGNDVIREAAELFRDSELNYRGFVEGDEIFSGDVNVVVCDGFSGNVALKTSEGLAQMISNVMREEFSRNPSTRLAGFMSRSVLRAMKWRLDYRRYNGASLLGLRKPVVKSHGRADALGFSKSIEVAVAEVRKDVALHLESNMGRIFKAAR